MANDLPDSIAVSREPPLQAAYIAGKMNMTYNMIRKQLYITEGQDEILKDRARKLGISEAELARRALSEYLSEGAPMSSGRPEALETLLERTRSLSEKHRLPADYQFDREDLYSDRMGQSSGSGR